MNRLILDANNVLKLKHNIKFINNYRYFTKFRIDNTNKNYNNNNNNNNNKNNIQINSKTQTINIKNINIDNKKYFITSNLNSKDDFLEETTGEFSDVFKSIKEFLALEDTEQSIELFKSLPYKTEGSKIFYKYFKKIIYHTLQRKHYNTRELFLFIRDNIHYFPDFINNDLFLRALKEFYDFEVEKRDSIVLEYYNHPFKNILDEVFEFYIVDFQTVENILAFLISKRDFQRYDSVFKMYIEKRDVAKFISKKLNFQSSESHQNEETPMSQIQSEQQPQQLNLNAIDLNNLPPTITFSLLHRAILNNEASNVRILLDQLIKIGTLEIEAFQVIFETCYYMGYKETEQFFVNYILQKDYRWYSLLIYFNQNKKKEDIFFRLLSNITDPQIPITQRDEILSFLVPINLHFRNFNVAFFWLQTYVNTFSTNIESLLYFFIYSEVRIYTTNSFFLGIWTNCLQDYSDPSSNPTQEKLDSFIKYSKEQFDYINNFKSLELNLTTILSRTNDKIFNNEESKPKMTNIVSEITLVDENLNPKTITSNLLALNIVLPKYKEGSIVKIIHDDSHLRKLIEGSNRLELVDYLNEVYFKHNYMPPIRYLFNSIYLIRRDFDLYKKFSLNFPSETYSLVFDHAFFNTFIHRDFNEGIEYLEKQANSIIKSNNIKRLVVNLLLGNRQFELATKMLLTMIRNNISISPVARNIVHSGRYHRYNIPKEIFDKLMKIEGLANIDSYILLKYLSNNQIKEAYNFFISNKEGLHHVDTIRIVLGHIFPQLFPLSDERNIKIWKGLLENLDQNLLNKKIHFYDSFLGDLHKWGKYDKILEIISKDNTILTTINQKTLSNILGCIKNDPLLVINLFKKSRPYEFYHYDIKEILIQNNKLINNGNGDPEVNNFLNNPPPSEKEDKHINKYEISDKTIEFIKSNYIDPSIVLEEPLLSNISDY
ncbi:hypothetical protein DICPUDRAFT_77620 [Dictyostelium purpureum]|uniref:Uncharacterized protein n=1 Tax=Dictyostelium purpureum TaxID=5786 RepID=F0ZH60_DICPU|nr:uncharacterized protein DICPUDRAFT_77620 [Dictyostelium purpureum]EGC36737.1 hypothetical protein DICPUDRAFT_77620 [Dictyostelium purpureum]|eukprot:XP_003286762.1 hypothetical protein DICPUDRAFT_77620 [Dictyostelium purpureum]